MSITLQIDNTVRQKQDVFQIPKANAVSENNNTLLEQETYQPSEEGLAALGRIEEAAMGNIQDTDSNSEENPYKDTMKAMKIAQSIMRGKIVPPQDEKFLIEFDAKLYQAAKNISMLKEQTDKVKSVLDDEEKPNGVEEENIADISDCASEGSVEEVMVEGEVIE